MTLLSITKWFFGILRLFHLMNRLSCSFLWTTWYVWNQHIWHGLGHTLWSGKIKGWFSYVLIRSICFWERGSWEKTLMSALGRWRQHAGTFLTVLLILPVPLTLAVSWAEAGAILQDSLQKRGVPPTWELSLFFFSFSWTQNGLWGRGTKYKPVSFTNIIY